MKLLRTYQTEPEAIIDSLKLKELGIDFKIIRNEGNIYPSLTDIYGYCIFVNDSEENKNLDEILSGGTKKSGDDQQQRCTG